MGERKTPWGGRFMDSPGPFQQRFGASLPVDARLYAEDIAGSIAHARMLAQQGVLSDEDAQAIESGLLDILKDIEDGSFAFDIADEDVHMAIEAELTRRIGDAGKRLHTARSRNDQVATDMRMYCKSAALEVAGAINSLREALVGIAAAYPDAVMPGYTHLQKAQPVLFAHHMLAYFWMLARDFGRVRQAYDEADVLPLGSAALAGTAFPIDREAVASELGFSRTSPNSLDAVSDRDFAVDLVHACALGMVHLSRLAEEIVLWSTEEFGFITLDDAWSTGSSIMPQKKNPDFAELVRGRTGRVVGDLTALLVMLKGLPLAYDKDMQEDKPSTFDAVETYRDCLAAMAGTIGTMTVHPDRMRAAAQTGFMAATDLADYLAARGVPFREAHEIVGRLVLLCEREGRSLQDLRIEDLQSASGVFEPDALELLDVDTMVQRRDVRGGTSHARVAQQLEEAREVLASDAAWVVRSGDVRPGDSKHLRG